MTSAPRSPSVIAAYGPASTREKSATSSPLSGPEVGSDIGTVCQSARPDWISFGRMIGFLDGVFDRLQDISTTHWFYAVIVGIALLDSIIPIVPSETAV